MNSRQMQVGAPVVALCGSSSAEAIRQAEAELTVQGKIVLAPFIGERLATSSQSEPQELLRSLHLAKIAMADQIAMANPGQHFTDTGIEELALVLGLGIPVSFTEPLLTLGLREDFWQAMLAGVKTAEVRKLDAKRASICPGQVIAFNNGSRTLLARVTTVANAPDAQTVLARHDPATIVPGADREQFAKVLHEVYPGVLDTHTPMVVLELTVLGEQAPATVLPARRLPPGATATWCGGPPPAGLPVTGAAGYLVDTGDGRVLIQDRWTDIPGTGHRYALPGGRVEDCDSGDLVATLAREAAEESQVRIDSSTAVYLGCQIITGHPKRSDPHVKARFLAPITLYDPIGPDAGDASRTYRRLMTSLRRARPLLDWGIVGDFEITAALAAARALGIPADEPASEGYRDEGDTATAPGVESEMRGVHRVCGGWQQ